MYEFISLQSLPSLGASVRVWLTTEHTAGKCSRRQLNGPNCDNTFSSGEVQRAQHSSPLGALAIPLPGASRRLMLLPLDVRLCCCHCHAAGTAACHCMLQRRRGLRLDLTLSIDNTMLACMMRMGRMHYIQAAVICIGGSPWPCGRLQPQLWLAVSWRASMERGLPANDPPGGCA